jgi:hypothetical protein
MFTKHFFKTLLVFIGIIALALIAVFWTSQMENNATNNANIAHTVGASGNVAN